MGVILIRWDKAAEVSAEDVSRALTTNWKGDLPVVLVSKAGFTHEALGSASDYEDAHLFAPSA
jgi:hypothetical protein